MSYNNAMVAHLWAQREKPRGRSSNGNLNFEGDTLYSYSTPIGRFYDREHGETRQRAILITSRRYSITTSSKHMPALWRAIGYDGAYVFCVPNVCPVGSGEHAANLFYIATAYADACDKARRARDLHHNLNGLAKQLAILDGKARDYAEFFKLGAVRPLDYRADAAAVFVARAERNAKRNAKRNTPAAIRAREKAAAAREARRARNEELRVASEAERLEAWRNGEPVPCYYSRDIDGGAYLRVRGDQLETSLGASVPLEHAIRVFRFVKLCRERGESWERNGRSLRVGHFQVDRVGADGSFAAGCHSIYWPEVERAAIAAGVIDEPAADTRDMIAAA